jgi:hypothetical protein
VIVKNMAYAQAPELTRAKAPPVRRLAEQLLAAKIMTGAKIAALWSGRRTV